jgi:hypothetical protein
MRTLSPDAKARIEVHFAKFPITVRERAATEAELREFEAAFGAIPDDYYRWLLVTCGGGVIGSERVDGIEELAKSHAKFRREFGPPRGWTLRNAFIIGWDGAGNPFGIDQNKGRILVEDHDFGGIHEMAANLEDFILRYDKRAG